MVAKHWAHTGPGSLGLADSASGTGGRGCPREEEEGAEGSPDTGAYLLTGLFALGWGGF